MENLTQLEIPVLSQPYNLTDGHAFRAWSVAEQSIVDNVASLFRSDDRIYQRQIEHEYVDALMTFGGQTVDRSSQKYFVCTTASEAIEIVANVLRLRGASLSLVEPCFDNLADIFKRHQVTLAPIPDVMLDGEGLATSLQLSSPTAVCIVSPNNPTGTLLSRQGLALVIEYCSRTGAILILDACFRAYLPHEFVYDQYAMLLESGIAYVVIEDTGKTWPTLELKAPLLTVSNSLVDDFYKVYADFLLHVSPFTVRLLTEFVRTSIDDFGHEVRRRVILNRRVLWDVIDGTLLVPTERPTTSVSWLKISGCTGQQFVAAAARHGVHVLPGNQFFWSAPANGDHFIRVALNRDEDTFARAAMAIAETCQELDGAAT